MYMAKQHWLRRITSQWFLFPQGTGIIAVILHELDYQFDGPHVISYLFWLLAIVLLVCLLGLYVARCVSFPHQTLQAIQNETGEVACLSSICITYTSIIQMTALSLVKSWSPGWGTVAYVLWWTNVVLAVCVVLGIPIVYVLVRPTQVSQVSPATQLPMIAALTIAAGGGTISQFAQLSWQLQVPVIIVSYLFIGVGLPLAFALDVLFWARLLEGSPPDAQHAFQQMILCGPWGQASFALQVLGGAVLNGSFREASSGTFMTEKAATPVGYASIFAGLLCWGTATFWWVFAIAGILRGSGRAWWNPRKTRYTLAAWSLVFPWVRVIDPGF